MRAIPSSYYVSTTNEKYISQMRERRASDTQRGLMDGAAIYKSSTPKKQKTKEDWNAFRKTDLFFFLLSLKNGKENVYDQSVINLIS